MKYSVILILLLGIAAGYLYYNPDLRHEWFQNTPLEPAPAVTEFYKWRDNTGAWHITDEPPPPGTEYEVVEAEGDITIMPLVPRD